MKIGFKLPNIELTREPLKENEEPPPADGLILPGVQAAHDIERVKSITHRFRVGYADRIGLRDSMEDKIVICGNFRNHPEEDYFAIFDGHAGKEASAYCADHMHLILESLMNDPQAQEQDLRSCITQSFSVTHERMKTFKTGEGNFIESGTTSLIAFFQDDDLFVANCGDSRAVFCQNKTSVIITEDHKPTSERELKRITSIPGGFVIKNRVQGKLAVARAIGDYKLNPYVTETPDVFGPFHWKDPGYEFLILACDGLWDVMEEQKACDYVRHCRDPREAAVKLRDWAYDERSKDNISVVVIWFPGFVPDEPIILEEPKPKPSSSVMSFSLFQNRNKQPEIKKPAEDEDDDDEEDGSEDDEEDDDEDDDEEDDEEDEEEEEEEEIKRDRRNEPEEEIRRDRREPEEEIKRDRKNEEIEIRRDRRNEPEEEIKRDRKVEEVEIKRDRREPEEEIKRDRKNEEIEIRRDRRNESEEEIKRDRKYEEIEIRRDRKNETEEEIRRDRKSEEENSLKDGNIFMKKEDKHKEEPNSTTHNDNNANEDDSEDSGECISDGENGINRKEPEKLKIDTPLKIRSDAELGDTYQSPKDHHENGSSGTDPTTEKLAQHSSSKCFLVKLPST